MTPRSSKTSFCPEQSWRFSAIPLWPSFARCAVELPCINWCPCPAEVNKVSRAEFERNLAEKELDPAFGADLHPLIAPNIDYDPRQALDLVRGSFVSRLPGIPWRGGQV